MKYALQAKLLSSLFETGTSLLSDCLVGVLPVIEISAERLGWMTGKGV